MDISLPELLNKLVEALILDWRVVSSAIQLPEDYDIPATCLLIAKKYADGWKALRLGGSFLLAEQEGVRCIAGPATELQGLEELLRRQAKRLRANGTTDFKKLLGELHPQLMASRKARNTPGNHSILLPHMSALAAPEFMDLGSPRSMLLCTDGFYRAVGIYGLVDNAGLMAACKATNGTATILERIREVEAGDPTCERYPRFKPADDASAAVLAG